MYLRKFFALAQISKKGAKSQPWVLSNQREDAQGRDLAIWFLKFEPR